MNQNQIHALTILDFLCSRENKRFEKRLTDQFLSSVFPPPTPMIGKTWTEWCHGWAFAVPLSFAGSLDIEITKSQITEEALDEHGQPILLLNDDGTPKRTKKGAPQFKKIKKTRFRWTQGSTFDFAKGYILYDSHIPQDELWQKSLEHIDTALQVTASQPAAPGREGMRRDPGQVEYRILKTSADRTRLEPIESRSTTQDGFVRLLIAGIDG